MYGTPMSLTNHRRTFVLRKCRCVAPGHILHSSYAHTRKASGIEVQQQQQKQQPTLD